MTDPHFTISNEYVKGWNTMLFPIGVNELVEFPNQLILTELVNVPKSSSIIRLLDLYEIDEKTKSKVQNIVNPTWRSIVNELILQSQLHPEKNRYILQLIVYISKLMYAKPGQVTDESINTLKSFNNDTVKMLLHLNHPSKLLNKVWHLCKEDHQQAARWTYYNTLIQYCINILPHPSQPRLSRTREHKSFTESLFNEQFVPNPNDKDVAKMMFLLHGLGQRFSILPNALQAKQEIERTIDPTDAILKNVEFGINAKTWNDLKKRRLLTGSRPIFCQCLYCWNFRIEETTKSPKVSGFCKKEECINADSARKTFLSDKGISATPSSEY